MKRISRCKEHDTTFIAEEDSMFDRCFVCVFEENDTLHKRVEELERELNQEEEDSDHHCKLRMHYRMALRDVRDRRIGGNTRKNFITILRTIASDALEKKALK